MRVEKLVKLNTNIKQQSIFFITDSKTKNAFLVCKYK